MSTIRMVNGIVNLTRVPSRKISFGGKLYGLYEGARSKREDFCKEFMER